MCYDGYAPGLFKHVLWVQNGPTVFLGIDSTQKPRLSKPVWKYNVGLNSSLREASNAPPPTIDLSSEQINTAAGWFVG